MVSIRSLLEEKREDILEAAERRGARNVRVFGSVARGDAGPESDVDFLVELDESTSLLQHNALIRELGDLLGCKVDVVSERGLRPRIRDRVLREAAPL
ncbi:MAG: nucleotidyltransferase family protein [Pseudomonadota bacterium]